jgi:hypothetical protein
MRFNIDRDSGNAIVGWIVLENPSAIPSVVVSTPAGKKIELQANRKRDRLRELGLHETGMVGFRIDEALVPGLQNAEELEIHNVETGVLLYRRIPAAGKILRRLFRYELQALPQVQLEPVFQRRFVLSYVAVERYSYDILSGIIQSGVSDSIYISGRPGIVRYQDLLKENRFLTAAVLRDPYEELAERLLFIRYASSKDRPAFLSDYLTGFEPLMDLGKVVDVGDPSSLPKLFTSLNEVQREVLSNPLIRMLACEPGDIPSPSHLTAALDTLAAFDVVGLKARYDEFATCLAELLATDLLRDHRPTDISWAAAIGGKLAQLDEVNALIGLDVELYNHAKGAIEAGLEATLGEDEQLPLQREKSVPTR